jgi:hypothetical protein
MAATTTPTEPTTSTRPATPPTSAVPDRAVAAMLDRADIEQLVHRLGVALDEGAFDDLRDLLTADVTASTPGGVAEGLDAVVDQASRNHDATLAVQHQITGVLVDLDGDGASVRANLVVAFAVDPAAAPHERLGGVYRFGARRTADGWRLTSVEASPRWKEGEPLAPSA